MADNDSVMPTVDRSRALVGIVVLALAGCSDDSSPSNANETGATSMTDGETQSDSAGTADAPPIPAACVGVELPAARGQDTQYGHWTTVAQFDADSLETWDVVPTPTPDQAILVLASHAEYDCDVFISDYEDDHPFVSQVVYLFPGPTLEVGTYETGTDISAWSITWLGDGMGNGMNSSGPFSGESLTISQVVGECVVGLKQFSSNHDNGFSVSTEGSCG